MGLGRRERGDGSECVCVCGGGGIKRGKNEGQE